LISFFHQDDTLGTSSLKEEKQVTFDGDFLQNVYFISINDEVDEEIYFERADVKPVKNELDKKVHFHKYFDNRNVIPVGKQEGFVMKECSVCPGDTALTPIKDKMKEESSTQDNVEVDTKSPEMKEKKMYMCDVCSVTFPQNSALRKHSVTHNGKLSTGEELESSHVSPLPGKLEKNKSGLHSVIHSRKHLMFVLCAKSPLHT
jgi:hypothetical protein